MADRELTKTTQAIKLSDAFQTKCDHEMLPCCLLDILPLIKLELMSISLRLIRSSKISSGRSSTTFLSNRLHQRKKPPVRLWFKIITNVQSLQFCEPSENSLRDYLYVVVVKITGTRKSMLRYEGNRARTNMCCKLFLAGWNVSLCILDKSLL